MLEDTQVTGNKFVPSKKYNSGQPNGPNNIYNITNEINSCTLETQINGINKLDAYWDTYGPLIDSNHNTHVFFNNLLKFAFEFDDPEINKKALRSLAFYALSENKEYPVAKLANPDLLPHFFDNLNSTDIAQVNNSILIFYALCNNQDVFQTLTDNDIFGILLKLPPQSYAPILMYKLLLTIFPKDIFGTEECAERAQNLSNVLSKIPEFVGKYIKHPLPVVVDKALKCFNRIQHIGLEVDASFIIQEIPQLLQNKSSNVVACAVKFLGQYTNFDEKFFDILIKISIKRTDITRKVFKNIAKRADMMSPDNLRDFFERLLYCCENLSLRFAEIAIQYLPNFLTADNAQDLRALSQFIKLIDSEKDGIVNASLQGINRYFELSQQGGFNDSVIDFLSEYTDKIEELSLSDNEQIAELGSLILEHLQ